MWKILRIVFTVLCAVCLAAILPVGTFGDLPWVLVTAIAAAIFASLMLVCKRKQETLEDKNTPAPDYFTPTDDKPTESDEK